MSLYRVSSYTLLRFLWGAIALSLYVLFPLSPLCAGNTPVSSLNTQNTTVELHTEPSVTSVVRGDNFILTLRISYYGSQSYWHLKSINGPQLQGARQVSHSVASSVKSENNQVICQEVHRFVLVATSEDTLQVGPVEVVVVGKDDDVRHLSSNAFTVEVVPSLLSQTVEVPVLTIVAVIILGVVGLVILQVRRKGFFRTLSRGVDQPEPSLDAAQKSKVLLAKLDRIGSPSVYENRKQFYHEAFEILKEALVFHGLDCREKDVDGIKLTIKEVQGISESLEKGLRKFIEEMKLVRFAGLTPAVAECEQICSRLKELIVLNVDPFDEDSFSRGRSLQE